MRVSLLTGIALFVCYIVQAQVKIGDNPNSVNARSLLELESTTKGLLMPRMTNTQIAAMTGVPKGMLVFSSTDSALYLRRDTGWVILALGTTTAATNKWATNGNDIYSTNTGGKVGIGVSNPYSQLSNTSSNISGSDGYGGNDGSFTWSANQFGYAAQVANTYGFGAGNGLVVRVNNANVSTTALDVNQAGNPLLIVKANGKVGINSVSPSEALDVAGTTKTQSLQVTGSTATQSLDASGTVKAQQFAYNTAQTRHLSLSFEAFSSSNESVYKPYHEVQAYGGGSISAFMWLTGGTAGQPGYISAPVNLPQGAVITGIELTAIDNDGTSVAPQVTLAGLSSQSGSPSVGLSLSVNAAISTESPNWQTISTALNHTVQNDFYTYKVTVRLNQNSGYTKFHRVRITYIMSNPD